MPLSVVVVQDDRVGHGRASPKRPQMEKELEHVQLKQFAVDVNERTKSSAFCTRATSCKTERIEVRYIAVKVASPSRLTEKQMVY